MPRPLRIEYEGARYHLLSRGDRPVKTLFLTMRIGSDLWKPLAKQPREPVGRCMRIV